MRFSQFLDIIPPAHSGTFYSTEKSFFYFEIMASQRVSKMSRDLYRNLKHQFFQLN